MMMDMDRESEKLERRTKTTLTEGDLEYQVLAERSPSYSCCFQFGLYVMAMIAGLLQGYQIGIIAGTELLLGDEYAGINIADVAEEKPDRQEREFFISFFSLGAAIGALGGAALADAIGRKWATLVGNTLIAIGFVIVILAPDVLWGFVGRFVSGIGQGIQSFSIPLYLNEVGTASYNKIVAAMFTLFTGAGMITGLNLAVPFRHNWKILYEFGLIPIVGLFIFVFILPESQAYYIN